MNNIEVVETWFRRVWQEQDASAISELFVPDTKAAGLGNQPIVGPDEFRNFHSMILALISVSRVRMDQMLESEGGWVTSRYTFFGHGKAVGEPVEFQGCSVARVVDGKLVEGNNYVDFLTLFAQLGFVPGDALHRGLSGQRLT